MKRTAVIAVEIAAAVLVGLAARELWLAVRGESSGARPARAVDISTSVTPNVVAFGTPVVATADVVADARVVDPDSIRLLADFSPYEVVGSPMVARDVTGDTARVVYRYTLRCLREGCDPAAARGLAQFEPGIVRYRFRDSQGSGRDIVDWPSAVVASRVAAADVEAIRWRASETELPALTTRLGPKGLAAVLLLGALALVATAVLLGRRLWHVPPEPDQAELGFVRPPLARALDLVRADLGNGASAPDRRRTLERVARELSTLGRDDLADEARALAWSPRTCTSEEIEAFARRAEDAVPESVVA